MAIHQSITGGGAAGRGAEEPPRPAAGPQPQCKNTGIKLSEAEVRSLIAEGSIKPIPVSGANAADCEKAIETMRTTFALVRSLVRDTLDNLNENLPVTATVNYTDQINLLYDMEGDLVGKIANAAEQV